MNVRSLGNTRVIGQRPREIALRTLLEARDGGFIEDVLETHLAAADLPDHDRGLCRELVFGTVRWRATLDWLISRRTQHRPQKAALEELLRLGLYQIFWLDRVPDHAAVHETVNLSKAMGLVSQAGFINAVLRASLRDGEIIRAELARLRNEQPALGWSQPAWLVDRWLTRWGAEKTAVLLAWNNTAPSTFARRNAVHFTAADLEEQWTEEGVKALPKSYPWVEDQLVYELASHPPLSELQSFLKGGFYVQDPSTLLAVAELDPQPGERILDACAAPGGKATYIAQRMQDKGEVIAEDSAQGRLETVKQNFMRLGLGSITAVWADPLQEAPAGALFDRILIDAPCSNTGVLRRRVQLRWRVRPDEILRLRTDQLQILERCAPRLRPGGILVYSTCSLESEENEEVVAEFLAKHPEFTLENQRALTPMTDGVDGAFVARLKKS